MLLPTRGSYWIATLFIIMALCVAIPAHAQFIVHDPGNADINLITAIESAATTAQAVLQTANQLQELLPLDDIALAVDFLETVATVQAIVEEATALIGDVQTAEYQVRALFGLDNAPRTPNALQQRVNEIKALIFEARVYATRVQSLITTLGRALGHLSKLVSLVGIVTGNHSANQVIIQQLSLANQTLVTSTASQMAAQRADTLQQMSRELVIESLNRMEADSWASWPGVGGR